MTRTRLYLIGGAVLVFLGGLLVAVGRWNGAETDRAFVAAAALAAAAPPAPGGVRYWAPVAATLPGPVTQARIEAAEHLRQLRERTAMPQSQAPSLPPRGGPLPADKPAAVPR